MTTSESLTGCSVCGRAEPDARLLQDCFECGNPFHLNPRTDIDGQDCGDAWIGETLGVEYYCQTCIDRLQAHAMGGQTDPAGARYAELVQAMTPGAPPLEMTQQHAIVPPRQLPPKPERPRTRRRYRRIDP
jgi:hypothetical protein